MDSIERLGGKQIAFLRNPDFFTNFEEIRKIIFEDSDPAWVMFCSR
jgi:hypothetical protein